VKIKNVFIAFVVVVAIVAGVLIIKNRAGISPEANPSATPSVQEQLQNKFNGLVVPKDTESADLKDVSGGNAIGLATRSEILADLPTPPVGENYQGWLEDSSGNTILLGTLKTAKGGWILSYDSSKYPGYNKIIVTLGEKHILEGSF
jgi:hypothetical protein